MRKLHNDGRPIRIEDRLPALEEVLRATPGLVAAYLFGSYGTEDQTPLSDVDLALVFKQGASPGFDEELRLRGRILDALAEEDVSITLLDQAPPVFQLRVLETGRLLYCADPDALADFQARTFSRHADFIIDHERFCREYDEALVARYAHG